MSALGPSASVTVPASTFTPPTGYQFSNWYNAANGIYYNPGDLIIAQAPAPGDFLRLSGAIAEPMAPVRFRVASASSYKKSTARREFVRARLDVGPDGGPRAKLYRVQDLSVLSSLIDFYGLVDLREDTRTIEPGTMVDFIPYAAVHW